MKALTYKRTFPIPNIRLFHARYQTMTVYMIDPCYVLRLTTSTQQFHESNAAVLASATVLIEALLVVVLNNE